MINIVKPLWTVHNDDKDKPQTIFSIAIHPDSSRVATGGIDTKIRIWSTAPILDQDYENNEKVPKLLSTMTSHSGVVMCIRWNNSGKYLASGSDDRIVMIWNLEFGRGGKVWGSNEENVENWKAVRRLVGHDSDVSGVAWSSDDLYLASVGLDSTVLIWSGRSFELLRKLDGHQGFIKGVIFDPVGQYLATQSDDNTVKIWSTDTWMLVADITAPFKGSPKTNTTRLTWSPEGTHIVTPNSMNGPVFVAAVIDRKTWTSNNSMVGHENIIEVAAFNPILFLRDASKPPDGPNLCTVVALCARSTISIWVTSQSQPLVVFDDVFDRDVLDLSWSSDGTQLWACSSEGHVAVFTFALADFHPVAPEGALEAYHQTFGYRRQAPLVNRNALVAASSNSSLTSGAPALGTMGQPNTLIARKGPNAKRRVPLQPQQMPSQQFNPPPVNQFQPPPVQQAYLQQPYAGIQQQQYQAIPQHPYQQTHQPQQYQQPMQIQFAPVASGSALHHHQQLQQPNGNAFQPPMQNGGPPPTNAGWIGQPPVAAPQQVQQLVAKKRKVEEVVLDETDEESDGVDPYKRLSKADYRLKGRTVGEDRKRPPRTDLRQLRPPYIPREKERIFEISNKAEKREGKEPRALAVPAVETFGSIQIEDSDEKDTFEWRNFAEGDRKGNAEVAVVTGKKTLWVDYLPHYVVCAAGSEEFVAVSTEEGGLVVYSPTGRRLFPILILDSPCSFLEAEGPFLLAITSFGSVTVWNTSTFKSVFPPLSISPLLTSSATRTDPSPEITTAALQPNGVPVIALSSGSTLSYDADLAAWTRLCDPWWSKGSDLWENRRGKGNAGGRGIVRGIESAVNDIVIESNNNASTNGDAPMETEGENSEQTVPEGDAQEEVGTKEMFRAAVGLAHLETRMKAAIALKSDSEYKTFLLSYSKRLSEEGYRSKAEELVRELLGPVYFKPGGTDKWVPTVLGWNKRDLLKEVLSIFAKSRMLTSLGTEYQDTLKKIAAA
ncbi:WD40 repeat-like protein [Meredithblackwellia eburnea MCA 4105]